MSVLFLDLETRSRVNLKTAGLHRYAEDVEITLFAWAIDDGPVHVEVGPGMSVQLFGELRNCSRIVAHNAEFDRSVMQFDPSDYWYCTASQARRHGLPGGLDKLCEIFNVASDKTKLKAGHAAMLLFCKPLKDGSWATAETHPAEWAIYLDYARLDIEAMRVLYHKMPKWNDELEALIYALDQRVNARGFMVDIDLAQKAIDQLAVVKDDLAGRTLLATDGQVASATQVDKMLAYILSAHGVELPDMQAATIERRLKDENLPDAVRELLQLRQQSSKSSTAKYKALMNTVCSDSRLRGTMVYCGAARTGRWAGKGFQPHNMVRRTLKQGVIDEGIRAIKADVVDLLCDLPLPTLASQAMRGALITPPGKKYLIADYSNIEGRVVAWLAGEQWKLDAFAAYDNGSGPDLYKLAYARSFGVSVDDVDDDNQRQIGKVQELMLGFGGGVGAFITGAATYKIDLAAMAEAALPAIPVGTQLDAQKAYQWALDQHRTYGLDQTVYVVCDSLKRLWRGVHPRIEQLWQDAETAVRACLADRKPRRFSFCQVTMAGSWLRIQLPSGRFLCYPGAQIKDGKITYLGQNPYSRQWGRISTYGGKLVENITQGFARDILAHGLVDADKTYPIVLHVHDEGGAEVNEDVPLQGFIDCLIKPRSWTQGLPLTAKGFETTRYRKD